MHITVYSLISLAKLHDLYTYLQKKGTEQSAQIGLHFYQLVNI